MSRPCPFDWRIRYLSIFQASNAHEAKVNDAIEAAMKAIKELANSTPGVDIGRCIAAADALTTARANVRQATFCGQLASPQE